MPYLIITIDTEADNQWDVDHSISTENVSYLPRFQELCEIYNYKPVYLVAYEVATDQRFIDYFSIKQKQNLCEIGMHCHAWSTPPEYDLEKNTDFRPYLIEYPIEIMEEKIAILTDTIYRNFGIKPVSHRSGRWSMNDDYFKLLKKYGYLVDCSVTPHESWEKCPGMTGMPGTDYSSYKEDPYFTEQGIMEVPVSIIQRRAWNSKRVHGVRSFAREINSLLWGRNIWLRPNQFNNINEMKMVIDAKKIGNKDVEFMIHSSELMPGGSYNFPNEESIEVLYKNITELFEFAKSYGYKGITLKDYWSEYRKYSL